MSIIKGPPLSKLLRSLIAAAVAIVILGSVAYAQEPKQERIDLTTAVGSALSSNPRAKLADSETRIADSKIEEAKSGKAPFIQAGQSFTRSNNPVFVFGSLLEQGRFAETNFALNSLNHPDGLNNFRTAVEARVPIFDQRQTWSRVAQARNGRESADFATEAVRQQLRFEVIRSYYGVVLAESLVGIFDEAVKAAEANLKKTSDMVEVGMTTKADRLAADVELAHTLQRRLEAESNLETSNAELNLTIGKDAQARLDVAGTLRETYFPIEEKDRLIGIALENRPELKQIDLEIENSRLRSKAVEDEKLPQISAFGNYGYSSPYIANGSADYTVGVTLSYTLFDPGRKARLSQAVEGQTAAGFRKQMLEDRIRLEVIRAYEKYNTSRAKIQVSVKSIAQAEEALRIVQDRYKFALASFDEVLRAEAALVRSKHDLMMSRYEYYVSYAAVLLATGRLNDASAFE